MNTGGRLPRTIVITAGAFFLNYGLHLVLTGYLSDTLGAEAVGFVSLARNAVQYAALLTLVLNDFVTRYIAVSYHVGDYAQANRYRTSAFWGDVLLSVLILAAVCAALPALDRLLRVPQEMAADVRALFFLTFLSFCLTTALSVLESSALLANRLDRAGAMKALSCLLEAALLAALYTHFPPRLCYVGLGALLVSAVMGLTHLGISRRYTPRLRLKDGRFSLSALRTLILQGAWSAAAQLGNVLNSGLDLLVCDWMLSPLAMGQLAIAKTLETVAHSLAHLIQQSFQPLVLKSYAQGDRNRLLGELKLAMKLSGLLMNVVFAGVLALGPAFFRLWVPSQDAHRLYGLTVATLLLCPVSGLMTPLYPVYTLTARKRLPCLVNLAAGIANVASMYVLISRFHFGVYAVALTTTAIMGGVCLAFHPVYLAHCLGLPWTSFYPCIFRSVLSCAVQSLCFLALRTWLPVGGWAELLLSAAFLVVLGAALHIPLVCEKADRQRITAYRKRRI